MSKAILSQYKKLIADHNKYEAQVSYLLQIISQHADFSVFIEYHPSDGFLVMSDDEILEHSVAVGMPLIDVINLIDSGERLTVDNWAPIG